MPGVIKQHKRHKFGRSFPNSLYDDPRGGRASALERNVLRYRAIETVLCLFFVEEIRAFLLNNVQTDASTPARKWVPEKTRRATSVLLQLARDATRQGKITREEAAVLRELVEDNGRQGKQLKAAFARAIDIGMLSAAEANELSGLIAYRNDVAHRIHLVMADISRSYHATSQIEYAGVAYKTDALDRLRFYQTELWERLPGSVIHWVSWDGLVFDMAEKVFEDELKRLDRLIRRQIQTANAAHAKLRAELDLSNTELVGDLSPRFPANHYPDRYYGDDLIASCKRLTKRGAEICYRLYDLGKSPLAVAWLMGISLAAAKNRQRLWNSSGGVQRVRAEVQRYALGGRGRASQDTSTGSAPEAAT